MHLACVNLRMTMDEALVAATINAAASLGKSMTHGSLEVGKVGDMIIIDAPRWVEVTDYRTQKAQDVELYLKCEIPLDAISASNSFGTTTD